VGSKSALERMQGVPIIKSRSILLNYPIKFTLLTYWVDHLFIVLTYWLWTQLNFYSSYLTFIKHIVHIWTYLMSFATIFYYLIIYSFLFNFSWPFNFWSFGLDNTLAPDIRNLKRQNTYNKFKKTKWCFETVFF